ncbi:biotin-dependent carboxyltransferase family protein [Winogradskyella maritima]|uniref:Biotin-dependent carboxyltransferase family protein n=1 Tax=Winogradskyella maritima TaxID=1517766 RepID=A0ABV8AIB1_9FLAO|nr:biotin-dependent carboxyltransferase family protein [Winogradskyella maritima]
MVEIVKAGLYSSIQDLGRYGHRHLGVPVSGVMDSISAKRANLILGNAENNAVLEMTLVGPTLHFHTDTLIAFAGADFEVFLNNESVDLSRPTSIHSDDVLIFKSSTSGSRGYLAVRGGFQTKDVLGSRSFYAPITAFGVLKKGDRLPVLNYGFQASDKYSKVKRADKFWTNPELEVYKGPEFDRLSEDLQRKIIDSEFKVSNLNNRMAYRLEPLIPNDLVSIITGPLLPGTVQLTPKGQLIVLMRDAQTTGGYPRVLQLTELAIDQLAQKTTDDTVSFKLKE